MGSSTAGRSGGTDEPAAGPEGGTSSPRGAAEAPRPPRVRVGRVILRTREWRTESFSLTSPCMAFTKNTGVLLRIYTKGTDAPKGWLFIKPWVGAFKKTHCCTRARGGAAFPRSKWGWLTCALPPYPKWDTLAPRMFFLARNEKPRFNPPKMAWNDAAVKLCQRQFPIRDAWPYSTGGWTLPSPNPYPEPLSAAIPSPRCPIAFDRVAGPSSARNGGYPNMAMASALPKTAAHHYASASRRLRHAYWHARWILRSGVRCCT